MHRNGICSLQKFLTMPLLSVAVRTVPKTFNVELERIQVGSQAYQQKAVKENHIPHATIKIFGVAEQEQGEYIYRKRMAEGKDIINTRSKKWLY